MAKRDFTRTLRWMREGTERRRRERTRRKRTYVLMAFAFLGLLVLSLPSLVSYSPLMHSLLRSNAAQYGWEATAATIRIGWITPLRIRGLEAKGESGETLISAESVDAPLTLLDLIRGKTDWGTVHIDDLRMETNVYPGGSKLEDDLATFWNSPPGATQTTAELVFRDAAIQATDLVSKKEWRIDQLQSTITVGTDATDVTLEGVVTDPDGISGALQGSGSVPMVSETPITLDAQSDGIPLSLLQLAAVRLPQAAIGLPEQWSGNATGKIVAQILSDGNFRLTASPIDLRNLVVYDPRFTGTSPWKVGWAKINGGLGTDGDVLHADHWSIESDAGTANLHGALQTAALGEGRWIGALVGDFSTDFDLAALAASTPGLIPLRSDVAIERGRIQARVSGEYDSEQRYRSTWQLKTEPIRATVAAGNPIVLDPVTADITLRPVGNWITAERLLVRSSFGEATASGDFRGGEAQFHLDFGRLSSMLRSVLDLPNTALAGVASGNVRWNVNATNAWTLSGTAKAQDLIIGLTGGEAIRRPSIDIVMDAQGVWAHTALERLDVARVRLSEPGQEWNIELITPVPQPNAQTVLPLRIRGGGQLEALTGLVGPWLPDAYEGLRGSITADVTADSSFRAGRLRAAEITLRDATLVMNGRRYDQNSIKLSFDGALDWPEMNLTARTFTISGNAVSLAVQGDMNGDFANLEIAYRADLSRLQGAITRGPQNGLATGPSARAAGPLEDAWRVTGSVEGRAAITRDAAGPYKIAFESKSEDLQALQPPAAANTSGMVGPIPRTTANLEPKVVWYEPKLAVGGDLRIDQGGSIHVDELHVAAPWLAGSFTGTATFSNKGHLVQLKGPAKINTQTAGDRVSSLLGEPIRMTGLHETPLTIKLAGGDGREERIEVIGSLGWESAQVAGVNLGATAIPLTLTEHVVLVEPATIPLDRGQIHVAGEVHYRPGVLWFEQRPGMFAEGIQLTPEMCRGWLKYMLPLAADATDVSGSFSVELAECLVIPSDPVRSRVTGSLRVEGAAVGPGPLTKNLLATIDQLEMATKGLQGQTPQPRPAKQWIQMEPQAVDFSLIAGQVSHQRLLMKMGKVDLISSGNVALDGRLDLRVQVPLKADWLGPHLASLSGRQITLPIGGTFARPSLDTAAVTSVIGQLGTQAVQSTAENYLQRQLDRQFQKLLGK